MLFKKWHYHSPPGRMAHRLPKVADENLNFMIMTNLFSKIFLLDRVASLQIELVRWNETHQHFTSFFFNLQV